MFLLCKINHNYWHWAQNNLRTSFLSDTACSWVLGGRQQYFVFTVLSFGLVSACYLFTKLLRPVVWYWQAKGILVVVYLDDGIAIAQRDKVHAASKSVKETLQQAGFVAHLWKSQWKPSTFVQWLVFVLDSNRGQIRLLEDAAVSLA